MSGIFHKITPSYDLFRSIFWFLNFLLAVSAGGVIAIGVIKLLDVIDFNELVEPQIAPLQIAIIVIGSIQAVLAFFGFLTIVMEKFYMLYGYLAVLALVILKKFLLPIGWNLGAIMFNEYFTVWNNRTDNENMNFINLVQKQFKCCGLTGPSDYVNHLEDVPSSCCPSIYNDCNSANQFAYGCRQEMFFWGSNIISEIQLAVGLLTIFDLIVFVYAVFIMIPMIKAKHKQQHLLEFERKLKMPK